ncbi:MAG: N-acetylglucosamine-6-phosphate deacetylase [Treponema sp.]|nr:N-acetylglucosamine-6-phosphate deacetylase [Treponema sp.]
MLIRCDRIFNEVAEDFTPGEILIEGEHIADFRPAESTKETPDYRNCYILPGFIDVHTHGGFGRAFMEISPEEIDKIALYFASSGVTAFFPTTVSGAEEACRQGTESCAQSQAYLGGKDFQGARLAGIYQEGPFLSPEKPGVADLKNFCKPNVEYIRNLRTHAEKIHGPAIKFVAIAPELEGAMDFIREVSPSTICALAHSTADYVTAKRAIDCGAVQITHLFNAMNQMLHREPGIIGAAFDSGAVRAELIADGNHVHPVAVRAAFRMFTDERIILISDSLFSGLQDGDYQGGGLTITLKNGIAKTNKGVLAGSSKTLGQCVINAVKNIKISLYSAVKCASVNPAKQAGIFHECGSIAAGKYADLVILDSDYTIKEVIVRGKRKDAEQNH